MTTGDKERTPLYWSIAAAFGLLVSAVLASLVQSYFANRDSEKAAIFNGLVASQTVASLASGEAKPEQFAGLFARLQAADPTVRRAFVLAEAQADALGMVQDADRTFVYDSLTGAARLRPEDAQIGTALGEISTTFDNAFAEKADARARAAWPPTVGQLFRPLRSADGTPEVISFAPVLAKPANADEAPRLLGVAGVVQAPEPPYRPAYLLQSLLFAAFGLLLYVVVLLVTGRARTAFIPAALLVLGLFVWHQYGDSLGRQLRHGEGRAHAVLSAHAALHAVAPERTPDLTLAWQRVYECAPVAVERLAAPAPAAPTFADQHAAGAPALRAVAGSFAMSFAADEAPDIAFGHTRATVLLLFFVLIGAGLLLRSTADLATGIRRTPGIYAYIAPVMVAMVLVVFIPFVWGVVVAFFNMNDEFVGLANFGDILFPTAESNTNFYFTLGVTVMWTITNVVLHVVIGLALALILNNPRVRLKGLYRVILVLPWAVPSYITALVWRTMFVPQYGAINNLLADLGLADASFNWFGSFWSSFGANLMTNVWLGFPFMMVVSLGALQSIPADLYEAADIDGASRWQQFRRITLPLLKPALFPAVILGTIWTFNQFNVIYLVSHGLPANETNILITEAYRFFRELHQNGIAAAYCLMIFGVLLLYTLITNRITRATEGAFD